MAAQRRKRTPAAEPEARATLANGTDAQRELLDALAAYSLATDAAQRALDDQRSARERLRVALSALGLNGYVP